MKFALTKEHRLFFKKNLYIEFDSVLKKEEAHQLNDTIHTTLISRQANPKTHLNAYSSKQLFLSGRDLWRTAPVIAKTVLDLQWARLCAELSGSRSLRLAYDQYLPAYTKQLHEIDNPLLSWYQVPQPLKEGCSIQPIAGALLITLSSHQLKEETSSSEEPTLSLNAGNLIYLSPLIPASFFSALTKKMSSFLLIAFSPENARYDFNPLDPQTNSLKQWGYTFGEKLNDRMNPILYRGPR